MVFGKKKKVNVPEEVLKSGVLEGDITPKKKGDREEIEVEQSMSEAQKALVAMAKELKDEYGHYLTPVDAANIPLAVLHSEQTVLLAGIFGELRKLNITLEEIKDADD